MVHPDANRRGVFATKVEKRHEGILDALQLGGILLICEFDFLERATRVNEIARIDAHLFDMAGSLECSARIEMNVGHERRGQPFGAQALTYLAQVGSLAHPLSREAQQLGAGIDDPARLVYATLSVHG